MRLLMVEDDVLLCNVIGLYLKDTEYRVDFCNDGESGLYAALHNTYDLILLDRMLPKVTGLEIVKKLRNDNIKTPVLILTALDKLKDCVDGLDAGADDYLTKPFQMEELLARIRALLRRLPSLEMQPTLLMVADVCFDLAQKTLRGEKGSCSLSKKEADLLELFFRQPAATLAREMLFNHVWGVASEVEEGNLDSYIRFVRRRLTAVSERVQIQTVRFVGYCLEVRPC